MIFFKDYVADSAMTCKRSGAEFIGIMDVPHEHELYKIGEKKKCKYISRLKE